ncbi:PQQ-binding-like beta-propeller repeat protein [bacterium]|nr:PQQ-binding-like beta-propeller repeat protein [bacterium]
MRILFLTILLACTNVTLADDWPTWRADAGRTASSAEVLPKSLNLQWILTFPKRERVWDDPLNHDLMSYDRLLEPVVAGKLMFVSFADTDKVVAYDIDTGIERWSYYTDGPARFSPVAWEEKLFFCSDDGYLYCVEAETGKLIWKFCGAPSPRKSLGNRRVISAWPARGGPVIRDGKLYFSASIWPFMGTFIYALDAETGAVEWVNDGSGSQYIKQPHSAPSFAGVAPQGALVALEDYLLVPGGRSVPAAFNRETGGLVHFNLDAGGKANGGSFVIGKKSHFYVHTRERGVRAYDMQSGKKTDFVCNEPVLDGDLLYTAAHQPDLKTKLDATEKAAKDALAASNKASKQLAAEVEKKASLPEKEIEALDEAKEKVVAAKKAVDELKDETKRDELGKLLAVAEKAKKEAAQKLDDAYKARAKPIDKKFLEAVDKRSVELAKKSEAHAHLLEKWEIEGNDVRVLQAYNAKHELQWEFEADGEGDLIKAGDRLYAAGDGKIVAVDLPGDDYDAERTWSTTVDGEVMRLLAANGKLFAVTLDGRILAFGEETTDNPLKPPAAVYSSKKWPFSTSADNKLARQVLAIADVQEGYAMMYGVDDGRMLEAFVEESELHVVAIDGQPEAVAGLREKFDYQRLYGERVVLHAGDPLGMEAPPYLANLIALGNDFANKLTDPLVINAVYESVRPYGGALWFAKNPALAERIASLNLPQAEISAGPAGSTLVFRQGALPDSADWTHLYGDMGNTVKSDDKRVKLPLGVLWFGGSPNTDVLPRHGHGPREQVVGGRTIIEGMNRISARDVYTGRVLWKRDFDNLGTYGIYYDKTYKDDPLNPAYNQVHIPGANARGTNYVATEDFVYIAIGSACHVLDAATGQDVQIIELPRKPDEKEAPSWAYIGVAGDLLLAGNDFSKFTSRYGLDEKKTKPKKRNGEVPRKRKRKKQDEVPAIEDLSSSQGLVAFDRLTGEVRWQIDAEFSFLHNAIIEGGGYFYLLDKLPKSREEKMKRRGLAKPEEYRLIAVDAKDGKIVWEKRQDVFGTWLSYSKEHGILLQAGAKARDRSGDEVGEGMIAYDAKSGDVIWEEKKRVYEGPCILHNDLIITAAGQYKDSAGAFHIKDGKPYMVLNPLTGGEEPWRITRAYGCNTPIAGEHLLTFRSGSAGFYDLDSMSGTGNFGGFRSGCSSTLIPANGVLNAPDYTRTCSCGYQNQTSLALVHMPDVELWTYNRYGVDSPTDENIERVGINFGAPGDRRSAEGTLWLESPSVGGDSPLVRVDVEPIEDEKVAYFRRHSSQVESESALRWVAASGIYNARKITITPKMEFKAKQTKDTLVFPLVGSENDAEEGSDGVVSLTSGDLELVKDKSDQTIGMRFEDIQVFPGDKITKAHIQFEVKEADAKPNEGEKPVETKLHFHAELADNASPFTSESKNLSSRLRSEKLVEWKPKAWKKAGDKGGDQHSANIASLLQEVVNREGWQFGNAVAFFVTGEGKRVACSSDDKPEKAPKLVIEVESKVPRVRVAAKEDDAEEAQDGNVKLDSSDLEFFKDDKLDQVIGMRFRQLQIPRGQMLKSARIQFTAKDPSKEPTEFIFKIEDNVDAAQFKSEAKHITSRKATDGEVRWSPEPWETKDASRKRQRSPNLISLIQPIIDRDDWKPGNSIAFMVSGTGHRNAVSFDGKKEHAPKLILDYETADAEIPIEEAPRYTVRLHFFDPDKLPAGERLFNVSLQGKPVLTSFDLADHLSESENSLMHEFTGVAIPHRLEIGLESANDVTPVLSGVELIAEE